MRSSLLRGLTIAGLLIAVSGCTTITDWFIDEEELAIRRLQPIEAKFELQPVWQTDIGRGVEGYFSRLQPIVIEQKIYTADRQGNLLVLDAKTGNTLWQKDFAVYRDEGFLASIAKMWSDGETARLSSLSYGYEKLFLGSENGDLMALNPENGELIWHVKVPGEILAPAAIAERTVVVNTGSGTMFAFSEEDGEQLWRADGDVPPLTLRGISTPVAVSGGVVVGTATGHLRVSVLESGLTAWETPIGTPTGATELERIVDVDAKPLIYAGMIYTVAYNGTLAAVELRSGRIVWKREYGSYRNIALSGNTLYVVDVNSNVYALDRRNGVELWTQGKMRHRSLTGAVPFGEHVVVGDNWGYLHWLNKQTGEIEARYELGDDDDDESVFADPVVVGDTLVATTREGDMAALKQIAITE